MTTILCLAGAFIFAFLLGETIHEGGHYLAHLAYGHGNRVQIHLDPFGGSRIEKAAPLPAAVLPVTAAAGPLFNLLLGATCSLFLWRRRKPRLLPLLLWGAVAAVQEGVSCSLGLLVPGGDAAWIAAGGVPIAHILVVGILLLLAGARAIALMLPLAGVAAEDSFIRTLSLLAASMGTLMLLRYAHSLLASPASTTENLIPLLFSLLLAMIVAWQHTAIAKSGSSFSPGPGAVGWSVAAVALALGAAMFLFQVVV